MTSLPTSSIEFKVDRVYSGVREKIKPLELVGQAAEVKFGSKFWSCRSFVNHS